MKNLIIVLTGFLLISSYALGKMPEALRLNEIDRTTSFINYKAPTYSISMSKLNGLSYDQKIAFLKRDVYDYIMHVQDDYMEKNKSPIPLIYPKVTIERIDKGISAEFTTDESLQESLINKSVNSQILLHLNLVQAMNQDPVYTTISNMYYEILDLKNRLKKIEEKQEAPLITPATSSNSKKGIVTVLQVALAALFLSILSLFFIFKKNKKK